MGKSYPAWHSEIVARFAGPEPRKSAKSPCQQLGHHSGRLALKKEEDKPDIGRWMRYCTHCRTPSYLTPPLSPVIIAEIHERLAGHRRENPSRRDRASSSSTGPGNRASTRTSTLRIPSTLSIPTPYDPYISDIKKEKTLAKEHAHHLITYNPVFRDTLANLCMTDSHTLKSFALQLLSSLDRDMEDLASSDAELELEFRPQTPVQTGRHPKPSILEQLDEYMANDSVLGKYF